MGCQAGQTTCRIAAMLLAAVWLFLWSGVSAFAAGVVPLEYDIKLDGELIKGTKIYQGPVTVLLEPKGSAEKTTFWINQKDIWMLLSSSKETGKYELNFSADGNYNLQFKSENPDTLEKNIKGISFTISSKLNSTLNYLSALPDAKTADQKTLEGSTERVRMAGNLVNELVEEQRKQIPAELTERLEALKAAVKRAVPTWDDSVPQPPSIKLTSSGTPYGTVYPSAVTVSLKAAGTGEQILMEEDGLWKEVAKGTDGSYSVQITEQGEHTINFCTAFNGSHSTVVTSRFTVDPDIPGILSEVKRIRSELATLPLHDYVTDIEKVYLKYLLLPPTRQALVPDEIVEQMVSMYEYIIDFIGFHNTVQVDGRYIKAVGMYNSLGVGMKYLQRVPVEFHAERVPAQDVPGVEGTPLAGYRFSITPEQLEGVPVKMNPANPIRIAIQLPEELKGKKNVELYLLENGAATPMGAKVRSTEDNLVLYFDTTKMGEFVFLSRTVPEETKDTE